MSQKKFRDDAACKRFKECGKYVTHRTGLCRDHRGHQCAHPGCEKRVTVNLQNSTCSKHRGIRKGRVIGRELSEEFI